MVSVTLAASDTYPPPRFSDPARVKKLESALPEVDRLFAVMSAANPMLRRFVPIPTTSAGRLQPGPLQDAIRQGFRIVRWTLLPEAAGRDDERPARA